MTRLIRETTDMMMSNCQDRLTVFGSSRDRRHDMAVSFFTLSLPSGGCLSDCLCYFSVNSDEMRLPEGQKNVTSKIRLSPVNCSSGNVNS